MIVTFLDGDKPEKYEVEDDHVDTVYADVRDKMAAILDQYDKDERDYLLVAMAMQSIGNWMSDTLMEKLGKDKIIEISKAIKIKDATSEMQQ